MTLFHISEYKDRATTRVIKRLDIDAAKHEIIFNQKDEEVIFTSDISFYCSQSSNFADLIAISLLAIKEESCFFAVIEDRGGVSNPNQRTFEISVAPNDRDSVQEATKSNFYDHSLFWSNFGLFAASGDWYIVFDRDSERAILCSKNFRTFETLSTIFHVSASH